MTDGLKKSRKLVIGPDGKLPDDLTKELTEWLADTERSAVPPALPPWLAFPDLPRTSIGWRMGAGEDYLTEFRRWIRGMSTDHFSEFRDRFPEPAEWVGFPKMVREE